VQGKGYPNLTDNDWLWGGDMEQIYLTINHGIRNTTDPDARYSEMPKFGVDGLLEAPQINEVVEYVLQMSGQEHDAALASAGATVYADNCAACHLEAGEGDRAQGAPALNDAIWLYGSDRETRTLWRDAGLGGPPFGRRGAGGDGLCPQPRRRRIVLARKTWKKAPGSLRGP
jgi:cytochrome c oxidase cbb3-type subunit 3